VNNGQIESNTTTGSEIDGEIDKEWEIDNLPNRLTIFRLALIPFIITCLFLNISSIPTIAKYNSELGWAAGWAFSLASITDFFDGYIARKRNIITVFGSFLDPIADKFLVVSSLIMLEAMGRIPVIIVIILILRELYITSLRLLAGERGVQVPVGKMGKWKTALQMIGIPMLMAFERPHGIPMPEIGYIAIYGASIFSLYSGFEYTFGLVKKLKALRTLKKAHKKGQKQLKKLEKTGQKP